MATASRRGRSVGFSCAFSALLLLAPVACTEPAADFEFFDACDPHEVPDEACYAARREPSSASALLATQIALRYIDVHPAALQAWDWEEGVLMFALTELYRVTGDARIRAYFSEWLDHHIAQGYSIAWSDSCPPALTALALFAKTGRQAYAEVPREVLRYVAEDALRSEEGGISHLGSLDLVTLWVDSLFMLGMVLTRAGEAFDDSSALAEMGRQLAVFAQLLQGGGGLFVHAHGWPLAHDDDIYWARGNSWVTVAAADYLRARLLRHESDEVAALILDRQVAGILAAQDPDTGSFWTILNRPGMTYLETSATALFAYGLARAYRYGLASQTVLEPLSRAALAVQGAIMQDDQGRPYVTGISGPTGVGRFEDYAEVEVKDDLSYGVGAAILALIETSGLW